MFQGGLDSRAFALAGADADQGHVAGEIPAFAPGLEAARGAGDFVADAGKLPEGGAGAGCAAVFSVRRFSRTARSASWRCSAVGDPSNQPSNARSTLGTLQKFVEIV